MLVFPTMMGLNIRKGTPVDFFKIYVERLRGARTEVLREELSPDFMDVDDGELVFHEAISVDAKAYIAEDELVLQLSAKTKAKLPCSICNEMAVSDIGVQDYYFVVEIKEIKLPYYDFKETLREAILLEVPSVAECNRGRCPERKVLGKFLKKKAAGDPCEDEAVYFPFKNLEIHVTKE